MSMTTDTPTREQATAWLDRWDRQQELYIADREERFAVIADVVGAVSLAPVVIDLGAGPGSLSARLLDRFPDAVVVAVDADQLLLGLAAAAYGERSGLRVVEHELRETGWAEAVRALLPDGSADAIVSTTALHWLTREELAAVYAAAAGLLRPGGVLVNGDHLAEQPARPRLRELAERVRAARAARAGVTDHEDWAAWWDAVGEAPELAGLLAERGPRPIDHRVEEEPTVEDHLVLLRAAGFAEAGTVWQFGDDRVVVGVLP